MLDLPFICGQVRALESKLLDPSRLDRMVGAASAQDAFRVLVELQYSEYFDDKTTVKDFAKIIQQGLAETKQMLENGTDNHPGLSILWLREDINNLKRAAKQKFLEHNTDLENFTEDNGFSLLGNLTESEIAAAVFDGKASDNLPQLFHDILQQAPEVLEKNNNDFRCIELSLDQAFFRLAKKIAKKAGDKFLSEVVTFWIDSTNLRTIGRVFFDKEDLSSDMWIAGGSVEFSETKNVQHLNQLQNLAFQADFGEIFPKEMPEDEESLLKIERAISQAYLQFLKSAGQDAIMDISIPFIYFEHRLQNARMIKFVMFAKFHGLEPEKIYETLKHL